MLERAPDQVTLTYSEPVALRGDARFFDHAGRELAVSGASTAGTVVLDLPEDLDRGTYVVAWEVQSADGHAMPGSLEFAVGEASAQVAELPEAEGAPAVVAATRAIVQASSYAAAFLAAGLLLLAGGVAALRRLVRRVGRPAAGWAALSTGAGLLLTMPWRGGGWPIGEAVAATVLAGGLLVGYVAPVRALSVAGATAALLSFVLVGHSRASMVTAVVDGVHVLAGSVWLGGLVACALALRRLSAAEAGAFVARFSLAAAATAVLVAVSGSVLAWRVLGSWGGLVETDYGQLLLAKFGVVVLVVVMAAVNGRWLLPRLRCAPDASGARRLRRTVLVETAAMVAALCVTGFLVQASPVPVSGGPAASSRTSDGTTVAVRVVPGRVGPNTVTVEVVDGAGRPIEPAVAPRVAMFGADLNLGHGRTTRTGVGRYETNLVLPEAGTWETRMALELARYDVRILSVPVEIE